MGSQSFRLVPFGGAPAQPGGAGGDGVAVEGWIRRRGGELHLEYRLHDPAATIRIPAPSAEPRRRDELWQATCLELFLALPEQEGYREFNLSPSGDWNIYQLDGYRRGLRPDPAWRALTSTRRQGDGELRLALATTLPPELGDAPGLEGSLTAVLQSQQGACSYWALHHPGEEPDFHLRAGFTLRL